MDTNESTFLDQVPTSKPAVPPESQGNPLLDANVGTPTKNKFILERFESGAALVEEGLWAEIDTKYQTSAEVEDIGTWGEFRSHVLDFDTVEMEIDSHELDLTAYVTAIEAANSIVPGERTLEDRWATARTLPFAGQGQSGAAGDRSPDALPSDDELFERAWYPEYGDDELGRVMDLQRAMLHSGLPGELFEEFNLVEDTILDGHLGAIEDEDVEAVVRRMRELGFVVLE